jgi:aspartate/methionine/tyrosine aminotransferase
MKPVPARRLADVGEYYFSRKLEEIAQLRANGVDVISLGIGSPDQAPPPEALEASSRALRAPASHGYASYRSTPELRRAIVEWYARVYRVRADADTECLPLLGSKEGILYLSMAYLDPGDGVLVPDTGYPAYSSVAKLLGARIYSYPLTEGRGWLPDLDRLEKQDLTGCKLMWVNYPHMPSGARATAELFDRLAKFARERGILVCNDNPYGLVLNREPPTSLLSFDPAKESCAELNSLSKSFNMAGWRVGMLIASRAVVDAVLAVKSNADSGMFLPVQAGAAAALTAPDTWHAERNRVYADRRDIVWKIFDHLGFSFDREQVGLFVWARAPETVASVERAVDDVLARAGVFLVPGKVFGSGGERYARASLCATREKLTEALRRVETAFPRGLA